MIDEVVAEKSKRMFGSHEKADLQIEKETYKAKLRSMHTCPMKKQTYK